MAIRYLGRTELAERIGITLGGTAHLRLPEPDAYIGRTRGWLPETIDRWNAQRPGHGGNPHWIAAGRNKDKDKDKDGE